jgi:hypothetical protein
VVSLYCFTSSVSSGREQHMSAHRGIVVVQTRRAGETLECTG